MANSPNSSSISTGRSSHQRTLEKLAHIIYRDVVFAVDPNAVLPPDLMQRLRALRLDTEKHTLMREYLDELRQQTPGLTSRYDALSLTFYSENMTVCINITGLVANMENIREFEQDMRPRLESRLSSVRLVQKWDDHDQVWVWVLEMNEDVQEGLRHAKAKAKRRHKGNRAKDYDGINDGDAIEIYSRRRGTDAHTRSSGYAGLPDR